MHNGTKVFDIACGDIATDLEDADFFPELPPSCEESVGIAEVASQTWITFVPNLPVYAGRFTPQSAIARVLEVDENIADTESPVSPHSGSGSGQSGDKGSIEESPLISSGNLRCFP